MDNVGSMLSISLKNRFVSYAQTIFGTMRPLSRATYLAALLVACVVTVCSGCNGTTKTSSPTDKVIVIGMDFATTGGDASAGVPTQNGALMAVEDQAIIGLPGGYNLEAMMQDDTVGGVHDPAQGVRNVQTLIQDSHVIAIVGPQNSDVARAEIPIANQAKIALVSPTTTSVDLTDDAAGAAKLRSANPDFNTFFRVVLRDDLQGAADARFAYTKLHARHAYVIDDNEGYGKGIADVFAREFAADGGAVVERTHLNPGQQDFMALLTRVQGMHPDLVYYGGVVSTGGPLLRRQFVKLGIDAIFMGGDGIREQGFITAAGAAANGVYCSAGTPNLAAMPSAQKFLRDYARRFPGQPVGTYSANAYAAAQIVIETLRSLMQKNGGALPTREELVHAIAASKTPDTPLGSISFTRNGDLTTPLVSMWTVKNQKFVFLSQDQKALK